MSIKLMSAIWDASKLKGTALLLVLALADYANEDSVGFSNSGGIESHG